MKSKAALITSIILFIELLLFAQQKNTQDVELTIEKGKKEISNGQIIWTIPVTLLNNSKDTLQYYSMSCSWQNFYSVSTNKLKIKGALCDKNHPIIVTILPEQRKTVFIDITTVDTVGINFKVGFNLLTVLKTQNFNEGFEEREQKKNIIWSNELTIK